MTLVLASSRAWLPSGADRRTTLTTGRHPLVADHPTSDADGAGPTALGLLTASLAACTAMSARTWWEAHRGGDDVPEDVPGLEVVIDYDIGPPTMLHRWVHVGVTLDDSERRALVEALEHTPVTDLLRSGLSIRTRLVAEPRAADPGWLSS